MANDGPTIFLSHAHDDKALIDIFAGALERLFANKVRINYSSKEGAIAVGAGWLPWIHEQVAKCDAAIIVITPASTHNAWVYWEAGAVESAARVKFGENTEDKIKPISLLDENAGPPPVFAHRQVLRGRNVEELARFFQQLVESFKDKLAKQAYENGIAQAHKIAQQTRDTMLAALEGARVFSSDALVREWVERIDALTAKQKFAQAASVARWAKQSFLPPGADLDHEPIDFRLHRRFGDIYREQKDWERALREYELARSFSPRDVMILRELGRVALELSKLDAAELYARKIREIDDKASQLSEEIAAFYARVHAQRGEYDQAAAALRDYEDHADSYYLMNNIAMYQARAVGVRAAEKDFEALLAVVQKTPERSVWVQGSRIVALLGLGREAPARDALAELRAMGPSEGELSAMAKDFDFLCDPANGRWKARFDWRAAFGASAPSA